MMHMHNQVQVESRPHLILKQVNKGQVSYSLTRKLMHICTLLTPTQLNYAMNYPAVLLNKPP